MNIKEQLEKDFMNVKSKEIDESVKDDRFVKAAVKLCVVFTIIYFLIMMTGCKSLSIDKTIKTPAGEVEINYDNWMKTEEFKLTNKGITIWG